MDTESPLPKFLADRYSAVKAQYPGEGRRGWNLRVAHEFWNLPAESKSAVGSSPVNDVLPAADFVNDSDPLDAVSKETPELGIVLRTDYSDEDAWQVFYARLQDGEKEFASETSEEDKMTEEQLGESAPAEGGEDEEMDEDEEETIPIFKIVNPSSQAERALLTNISNLSALRLLNDVNIRKAPSLPEGTKRISPPNRLVDLEGWQEIYIGKNIWIYDTKSNKDQCVRVVSQQGEMYGTATGDSWRARVSHICELQVNLYSGAMKIDFGGLDRWDYGERQRNMQEANLAL